MIFGKGGSWKEGFVYGIVSKALYSLIVGGIIYWYATPLGKVLKSRSGTMSLSRLVTYSLGSAVLSFRKFGTQQLLCNQGTKCFTMADYKKKKNWNWLRGIELLSSCDWNMQHIENSLMLKPFLYISSVHEISFKPTRISSIFPISPQ